MPPLVSVLMITYKQAAFINQAVCAVLDQEVDFDVELIVADDCSPDGTSEIINTIKESHPNGHWIKYTRHDVNKGMTPNFIWALEQCSGRYIALCEGDDYWTDTSKLRLQVEFLENSDRHILTFHPVRLMEHDQLVEDHITQNRLKQVVNRTEIDIYDILRYGNFIHTNSVMFRKIDKPFPLEFYESPVGDYFLYIILGQEGMFAEINRTMGVYRNFVGTYSSLSNLAMRKRILKYHMCILSYLSVESQREIFLRRSLERIDNHWNRYHGQASSPGRLLRFYNALRGLFRLKSFKRW